jgi:lysozyme
MKSAISRVVFALLFTPLGVLASNSVVNMSHYDLVRADFVGMKSEGVLAVIHEATYPRLERDDKYYQRQRAAHDAGLLWGAYHFGDGTKAIRQADHFLNVVATSMPPALAKETEGRRPGVLLVLDFEKNSHYPGGSMSVGQAIAFVERINERTGKYPGLYCSEYRLRQMLYAPGVSAAQRRALTNCWLWIANYHFEPRNTGPWRQWQLWQYTGDGRCSLRPRSAFPTRVANLRRAERNIFRGSNAELQTFWQEHAWFPSG